MQSIRTREQLLKDESVYANQLKKMSIDLFSVAPKEYLIHNWGAFEIYLSIPNLLLYQRMLRYQAFFEALKTEMAIILTIFKRYNQSIELPADFSDNVILVDIETHPTYFKVTPAASVPEDDKVFAEDQVKLFEFIVDKIALLAAVKPTLEIDSLMTLSAKVEDKKDLAKKANEFYAKINAKLAAVKVFINAYQTSMIDNSISLDVIGHDAVMLGMEAQQFEEMKKNILTDRNPRSKKDQIVIVMKIVASIIQTNLYFINQTHGTLENIALLRTLRATEENFTGEFSNVIDWVLSGAEVECLDMNTLYHTVWEYYGYANHPSWLANKMLGLNQLYTSLTSYIEIFDDQKLIDGEINRQNNVFRIVVDQLRQHKDVKKKIDASNLFMTVEELKVLTVGLAPALVPALVPEQQIMTSQQPNNPSLEKTSVSRLNSGEAIPALVLDGIDIEAETEDYNRTLEHTKWVIDQARMFDTELKVKIDYLNKCDVPARKKLVKLSKEFAEISLTVSILKIEDKAYSPQNAQAVIAKCDLAQWALSKMRTMAVDFSAELKYVRETAVQMQKAEAKRTRKQEAAELKRQKDAEEAEQRRLKEEEQERLDAEAERLEAEEEARLQAEAALREEQRLAAIEQAKQEKLERKRLAQFKLEQEKLDKLEKEEQIKREQAKQEQLRLAALEQAKLEEQKRQRLAREDQLRQQRQRAKRERQLKAEKRAVERAERETRLKAKAEALKYKPKQNSDSPSPQPEDKSTGLQVELNEPQCFETTRLILESIRLSKEEHKGSPAVNQFTTTPLPSQSASPSPTVPSTELTRAHSAPEMHPTNGIPHFLSVFAHPQPTHSQSFFSFSMGTQPVATETVNSGQGPSPSPTAFHSLFGWGSPVALGSVGLDIPRKLTPF